MYSLLQTWTRSDGSNKFKLLQEDPQQSPTSALIPIRTNLRSDLARVAEVVVVSQCNCETATSQEQCQCRGQQEAENRFLQLQTDNRLFLCDVFSHSLTLIAREMCTL